MCRARSGRDLFDGLATTSTAARMRRHPTRTGRIAFPQAWRWCHRGRRARRRPRPDIAHPSASLGRRPHRPARPAPRPLQRRRAGPLTRWPPCCATTRPRTPARRHHRRWRQRGQRIPRDGAASGMPAGRPVRSPSSSRARPVTVVTDDPVPRGAPQGPAGPVVGGLGRVPGSSPPPTGTWRRRQCPCLPPPPRRVGTWSVDTTVDRGRCGDGRRTGAGGSGLDAAALDEVYRSVFG